MSEITYQQNGDYLIPNLTINQTKRSISRYGRMRRTFLRENRPILYNSLIVTGKLYPHLLEIEDAANSRMEQIMPEMMKGAGATESLKASELMNTLLALKQVAYLLPF